MRSNAILATTILALAALGHGDPVPINRRGDIGDAIDSYASIGGSYYSEATRAAASWYSEGLSAASAGAQEGLSDASTWLQSHAPGATDAGAVFTTVTSISGAVESMVTSVGGPAVTLAAGGAGVITSFAGSEYTVIANPTATANAAATLYPPTLRASPVLTALATVAGGTLLGAWLIL